MADRKVKFIRVRGRVVPIKSKHKKHKSSNKTSVTFVKAVSKTSSIFGAATLLGGAGYASLKTGQKANMLLSKVDKLTKEGTRLEDAYGQFKELKHSKGKLMAQNFLKDSKKAFKKANLYKKTGTRFGKASSFFGKISRRKLAVGLSLGATGIAVDALLGE